MNEGRVTASALRVLELIATSSDRRQYGLLQHELAKAFIAGGWSMADFQAATKMAYEAGWIRLDAQFYCLTDNGRRRLSLK